MGIIGILAGLIAAGPFIISKQPSMKQYLDKITPWTGWIGVCMFVWGLLSVVFSVLGIGLLALFPIRWGVGLANALIAVFLGFSLGYGLIAKYTMGNDPVKQQKGQELLAKIAPYQMILGFAAIIGGVLSFVF